MTISEPEVVAWSWAYRGRHMATTDYSQALELAEPPYPTEVEPLIRLADYQRLQADTERLQADTERLQAECEELRAEYEEELFQLRQTRDAHFGELMRALEQVDAMKAECERLRKDAERYRSLLEAVLREIPHREGRRGNAPGHGHSVPGVWDEDNGALAGKECAWCKVWREALAAMEGDQP